MKLSEKILPKYNEFHREFKNDSFSFYILKGGRGSAKSTHISIELILDLIKNDVNQLVLRKVARTLENSVYNQLIWAINHLGVNQYFKINKSPLKITYIPKGNFIIFLGADDTDKIKGLKAVKYPFARVWVEELADFRTEEEISKIINSVFREELKDITYKAIFSYNPPKQKHSWVNKKFETVTLPSNYYRLHTTYLDNPYMSKEFILEAEHTKEANVAKYEWEYLGKATGSGVVPFSNLVFEEITDEQIKGFDNIRQGLDWGYAVDPASFIRMHFDKTRRKLYIFGEIYQIKLSNEKLAEMIKTRKWNDTRIIADSSEPKSIENLKKDCGINKIIGAKKGKGSVETGEKWLDELESIIIDPVRCPNTAREFETADYAIDRQGNTLTRLEDKDNHSIDAVRYGLEMDMVKRISRRVSNKRNGF